MTQELSRRQLVAMGVLAGLSAPFLHRRAAAATPVQMVSHRYPLLEYYAERMRNALPGVEVNTQLMQFDKALELTSIAMSARSDTIDIVYVNDATVKTFIKNGWIRPLDDLWEKHKDEFNLGDYNETVLSRFKDGGRTFAVPLSTNTNFLFYRKDLFDAAGKKPPKMMAEYLELAKFFSSPARAGVVSCLKPADGTLTETHYYLNALADGWFDEAWRPVFNNDKAVAAIETLKQMTSYAQQGFTTAHNDECMIALQQDVAAMGPSWSTRAQPMEDPTRSLVVGKMDFVELPHGKARVTSDAYGISPFSKQDPDMLFRILARTADEESMRGAAALTLPPRDSVLSDPALQAQFRHYPAGIAAMNSGVTFPAIPEWYAIGDLISRRVLQAVTDEMPVRQALDLAARETQDHLAQNGYYK